MTMYFPGLKVISPFRIDSFVWKYKVFQPGCAQKKSLLNRFYIFLRPANMRKMAGLDFRSREMFDERAWAVMSEE